MHYLMSQMTVDSNLCDILFMIANFEVSILFVDVRDDSGWSSALSNAGGVLQGIHGVRHKDQICIVPTVRVLCLVVTLLWKHF